MLWLKRKHSVKLSYGAGQIRTDFLHGIIQQLIVVPNNENTIWSLRILDSEQDVIYQIVDHVGRLDDRNGVPVGMDQQERLTIDIYDSTANENFDLILKVREGL